MTSPEKRALLEAYERVLESNAERREREQQEDAERAARAPRRRHTRLAVLSSIAVLGVLLLITQPSWLVTPPPPPESPAVREASVRIALYITAQHISQFRERRGRLPVALTELHATTPEGLSYKRIDPNYSLGLHTEDGLDITYASTEPVAMLLGESFKVLAAGRKR